jgi:anti-anti-sigma factor
VRLAGENTPALGDLEAGANARTFLTNRDGASLDVQAEPDSGLADYPQQKERTMSASQSGSEDRVGAVRRVPETGGIVAVCLDGEFDLANAPDLNEEIDQALESGMDVIFDLTGATFIASTAINALFRAAKAIEESQRTAVLQVGTPQIVERVLQIVDIDSVLPRAQTRPQAVELVHQRRAARAIRTTTQNATSHEEPAEARELHSQARADRYMRNQLLSRRINEGISRLRHSSSFDEYVCECGLKTCVEPISLSREEFEAIRQQPGRFIVCLGHGSPKHGCVVDENTRYQLVEVSPELPLLPGEPQHHAETQLPVQ